MSYVPEAEQAIWEWLLLEAILLKWHPSELFVKTKACCELETESLKSGISGLGPEVCKSASRVVSELSYVFILHHVNMFINLSLVSFLPSSHVNIILQLVSTLLEGGHLFLLLHQCAFCLKLSAPVFFFFFL